MCHKRPQHLTQPLQRRPRRCPASRRPGRPPQAGLRAGGPQRPPCRCPRPPSAQRPNGTSSAASPSRAAPPSPRPRVGTTFPSSPREGDGAEQRRVCRGGCWEEPLAGRGPPAAPEGSGGVALGVVNWYRWAPAAAGKARWLAYNVIAYCVRDDGGGVERGRRGSAPFLRLLFFRGLSGLVHRRKERLGSVWFGFFFFVGAKLKGKVQQPGEKQKKGTPLTQSPSLLGPVTVVPVGRKEAFSCLPGGCIHGGSRSFLLRAVALQGPLLKTIY